MTTTIASATDALLAPADTGFRPAFFRLLRRAWLAAAAGGVAGFLVGGVGADWPCSSCDSRPTAV